MKRLVEVQDAPGFPAALAVGVGDLLVFDGTGGRVTAGVGVVEPLGALIKSVVGDDGRVLSPAGAPNAVVFLARRPGSATVEVAAGDPWGASRLATVEIAVSA
jgi:hypothetical protein